MNTSDLLKYRQESGIENSDDLSEIIKEEKIDIIARKLEIINRVREKLVEKYDIKELSKWELFNSIKGSVWELIEEEAANTELNFYLDSYEKSDIFETLVQTMFGYGVLDSLINDDSITEIMVNALDKIFIEKDGKVIQVMTKKNESLKFNDKDEFMYVVEKIVAPINRKVDESNPIVDARLPNGFRVNIVLNPISLDGSVITIRKFPENPYDIKDLIKFNTLTVPVAKFLKILILARFNIVVSGGTGTGKTTFLNALSNFIPSSSRVITIEDAAELKITKIKNLIRMETRPPNIEGKGEITIRNLVRTALRMRPDRIIVGEVRGGEALDMLQAMNTGHDGSLSTGHANSAEDMLSRLETMVLMAGVELPLISIRQQIASAVDIIVHLSKIHDGSRKVVEISEIIGVSDKGYVLNTLFKYEKSREKPVGYLKYTGAKLRKTEKFVFQNVKAIDYNEFN